ncbi:MAG: hypothetical protein KGK11_15335 [Sphingomonadales bacterium]|nr:hypothetical protein [Sphingomonadales bacterium]
MPDHNVRFPPDRIAVIDIGSNSLRLVVFERLGATLLPLLNEKVMCGLGRGIAHSGRLNREGVELAHANIQRFVALAHALKADHLMGIATAAVRDASDGAAFLAQIAGLGLAPRLLSGEEEAVTGARGVLAAFPGAAGVVADLGGGSLELTDIAADRCTHGVSLPLGTLRLPALRGGGAAKFGRRVRKLLKGAQWAGEHGQVLYLVGGSWRALARYAMERDRWPIDDPHGHELAPEVALKLARSLVSTRGAREDARGMADPAAWGPSAVPGISPSRLASLPDAAALLGVLVRELRPARLVFSAWGLREGLLAARLSEAEHAQDPLAVGVEEFVRGIDPALPEAARGVAAWTAPAAAPADAARERLRGCATLLALASMATEPNLRAELATDWALRKRWIGASVEARAMLALALRCNSGRTAIGDELLSLAPRPRLHEAQVWGLATRLCRRLTAATPTALAGTGLTIADGRLLLWARAELAVLYSETVARDHRWLAETMGLQAGFATR